MFSKTNHFANCQALTISGLKELQLKKRKLKIHLVLYTGHKMVEPFESQLTSIMFVNSHSHSKYVVTCCVFFLSWLSNWGPTIAGGNPSTRIYRVSCSNKRNHWSQLFNHFLSITAVQLAAHLLTFYKPVKKISLPRLEIKGVKRVLTRPPPSST